MDDVPDVRAQHERAVTERRRLERQSFSTAAEPQRHKHYTDLVAEVHELEVRLLIASQRAA